jgi:hypothetical protein
MSCVADAAERRTWSVRLGPWVYRLKRLVGFGVAAAMLFGFGTLGCSSTSGMRKLGPDVPLCASWSPLHSASPNSARVGATVFKHATRGPSAVYERVCGAAAQYRYVDTGTGRATCLGDALPYRTHANRWLIVSVIPLYRCD